MQVTDLAPTAPTTQPAPLTVADIAAQLRVTQQTVRAWIAHNALSATKVGNTWQVDPADYARFVDGLWVDAVEAVAA